MFINALDSTNHNLWSDGPSPLQSGPYQPLVAAGNWPVVAPLAHGHAFEPKMTKFGCRGLVLVRKVAFDIYKPLGPWTDVGPDLSPFQPLITAAGLRQVPEPWRDQQERERMPQGQLGHLEYRDECTQFCHLTLRFVTPTADTGV